MSDTMYLDQTTAMMRELKMLRAKNKAQADTIGLLKKQYDDLAADHKAALESFQKRLHEAYTHRDVAEREASEINIVLQTAAQTILDGLRAKAGDIAPPEQQQALAHDGAHNHPALRNALGEG